MDDLDTVLETCIRLAEIDAFQYARKEYSCREDTDIELLLKTVLGLDDVNRHEALEIIRDCDIGQTLEVYAYRTAKRAEGADNQRRCELMLNGLTALQMTGSRETLLTAQHLFESCKRFGINPRKLQKATRLA